MNAPILPARLVLEDGSVFHGRSFGKPGEVIAEVVFNTSHTGYQEVLTDPSYCFEAICFTVPILGIYGVADEGDAQAKRPMASGMLCREVSRRASNWRARQTLPDYLEEHGLLGIEQIDTRSLTQHLRDHGAQIGVLTTGEEPDADLVDKARAAPRMQGLDLASRVTTREPYSWTTGFDAATTPHASTRQLAPPAQEGEVVVVDFGVKHDILRHLASRGMRVTVVPAQTSAEEVLARDPDGVLLSNGPGDPAAVGYGIELARALIAAEGPPVFGVCLGFQLMCLAMGAKAYKLKFGHRGANHPVRDERSGKVLITSMNHG
ncbi:MAG: glutamine-hydrolyzing carbamoyl-phosphate synthase small subunit, partial [Planctomycetes bacterium]|nr:glutamine-hydrolyzing carbamoyl-phosphate synthase small subunit [Planctomycetota bacterium]